MSEEESAARAGEVGKLDIRLSHIERRVPMQRDPFRPAHEGA